MITGEVNPDGEAMIPLVVFDSKGNDYSVEAVIDTGYNGFITLPSSLVSALGLSSDGYRDAILADGTQISLIVYHASILWDGETRDVLVLAAEGGVLVGTALLHGYTVKLQMVDGGAVTLERLP